MSAKAHATKTQEVKSATTIAAAQKPVQHQAVEGVYAPFYFWQKILGNQAVQQWMQGIQRKTKIEPAQGFREQEVDRTAESNKITSVKLVRTVQPTRVHSRNKVQREAATRTRPWQEVNAQFADQSGHPIRLFSHDFGESTSLTNALQWIFENSMARPTSFQFVSERETIGTTADEAYLQSTGQPVDWYQEVALVWHLRRRRFAAYTTRQTTSTATDPRQGHIFVAHTHPTPSQVPGGSGSLRVSWQTMSPSPNDSRGFHPRQTVSIICHRDPADNQTPVAFVYDRSGQALARYRGPGAFQSAADDFFRRERSAGSAGRGVGQYPARR